MSGPVLEKQIGKIYESKRLFMWEMLSSEFLEGKELTSPKFSTIVGNTLSNWHLRCKPKDVKIKNDLQSTRTIRPRYHRRLVTHQQERQEECTSIFLHHNGQADIRAYNIRFVVFNCYSDDELVETSVFQETIFKTHMISAYFDNVIEVTNEISFCIGCEITFDQVHYDVQLQQATLPSSIRLREFDEFEKLLSEPRFADVSFKIANDDREPLLAHRNILSARSPVFEAMFAHEMLEKKQNRVDIEDIAYDVLKELLRYLYTAKLHENLELNMVADLLVAAEKYNVEGLKTQCEKILSNGLTAANAFKFLSMADTHNAKELRANSISFIVTNSEKIVNSEDFKMYEQLQSNVLCEIFQTLVNYKK